MTVDAAVHKRKYQLLSLVKKTRLMATRAEQRHEHLTEEERKISTQIRSVAATPYEKVDLNKPTIEFLCEHFFKDPTLALAYFYCCSQILMWQYSMMNYNQMLMDQLYGIAFQT